MNSHPTSSELIAATTKFLTERAAPALADRDAFLIRVAINALGVVDRQSTLGPRMEEEAKRRLVALLNWSGELLELNASLCAEIRSGVHDEPSSALIEHLRLTTIDQVRIDQPNYSGLAAALAASAPRDQKA